MSDNIQIEMLVITDQMIQAAVHLPGDSHSVFTIDSPKYSHPALREALANLEHCVQGAIYSKLRTALDNTIPPSDEPAEIRSIGLCRICSRPVATDDPGIRVNGPFYYCASHA